MTNSIDWPIELPDGGHIPLHAVAQLQMAAGPSTINREDGQRRIVVRVNTIGRDVGSAVAEIQRTVRDRVSLPEGYLVTYGGQFESQRSATRRVMAMSVAALVVAFLVLYSTYPSVSIVLQILIALPAAFVGGVLALWISGQSLTVASLVGFISLGGIAARNGLLLVSTYLGLIPEKGFNPGDGAGGQSGTPGACPDDSSDDRYRFDADRHRGPLARQGAPVPDRHRHARRLGDVQHFASSSSDPGCFSGSVAKTPTVSRISLSCPMGCKPRSRPEGLVRHIAGRSEPRWPSNSRWRFPSRRVNAYNRGTELDPTAGLRLGFTDRFLQRPSGTLHVRYTA